MDLRFFKQSGTSALLSQQPYSFITSVIMEFVPVFFFLKDPSK